MAAGNKTYNVNTVQYNIIPQDSPLLTNIPKIPKGKLVQFRAYGCIDPARPGKFFGRTVRVPPTDIITDNEGNTYDIAMIKSVGAGGVQELDNEVFFDTIQACLISLRSSSAREMRQYQYFMLCNYNGSNPNRDTSKPILFEIVDDAKDHTSKRTRFKKIAAAMAAIENFSEKEVLDFIRSNRLPDTGSHHSRVAYLEEFAQKDPDKFMTAPLIDHTSLYATIEQATKAKVITYNNVTREYQTYDKKVILEVKKGFGVSNKDELAKFLMSPEGHKDLAWIKAELEK
jgi:hypothetical protein